MRIQEIKIDKLFGMFNHTIPLNLESHLSIIYGMNGIGKTTIFKILDSFFNLYNSDFKFYELFKIPFEKLSVSFIDNSRFELSIPKNEDKKNIFLIKFYQETKKEPKSFNINIDFSRKDSDPFLKYIEARSRNLRRTDYDMFFDNDSGLELSDTDVLSKYYDLIPSEISSFLKKKIEINEELKEILSQLKIQFIETQRLLVFPLKTIEKKFRAEYSVDQYSKKISKIIKRKREEYEKISESLQLSLGKRMSSGDVDTNLSKDDLIEIAEKVESRREELKKVGLLDKEEETFIIPDNLSEVQKAVLSVSLQDMQTKLNVFNDLHKKLSKFLEILNERRLNYKKIFISDKGFSFINSNGSTLEPSQLSSGEQHELVLLYLLIFEYPENSLILIDEPEISLHIDWQNDFLKDMEDIIRLRNFDILISTHSPDIVNGRTELTIALHGN
jgi:predicted ATP-binding protein involved in virulence